MLLSLDISDLFGLFLTSMLNLRWRIHLALAKLLWVQELDSEGNVWHQLKWYSHLWDGSANDGTFISIRVTIHPFPECLTNDIKHKNSAEIFLVALQEAPPWSISDQQQSTISTTSRPSSSPESLMTSSTRLCTPIKTDIPKTSMHPCAAYSELSFFGHT